MYAEIGAYDAKTKLPELLRQVRGGQRFTITVRGEPVADLVPAGGDGAMSTDQAVDEMLKFEQVEGVGPE